MVRSAESPPSRDYLGSTTPAEIAPRQRPDPGVRRRSHGLVWVTRETGGFSKLCVEKQNSVSTKSALHVAWRWNSVSTAVKRVTPDFAKTTDQSPQCWRESGTFRAVI